ncbi:hypothetical protein Aperf_G00000125673 [Anoplocephala perfoliata]
MDGSDFFLQHPISQSVTVNSTFELACRIRESLFQDASSSSQPPSVQWVLNQFGLGTTREDVKAAGMESDSSISRYDLPYNLAEGQYDLQVRSAKSRDEGQYVCQLRYNGNTYFSQAANVRILVAAEDPTLVQSDSVDSSNVKIVGPQLAASAIEGSYLRLHCVSKNGKPGAKLSWTLSGSPLTVSYNEDGTKGNITSPIEGTIAIKSVSAQEPPFLVTTISEIVVYVTKLHHGSKIQCTALNEGYENYPLPSIHTKLNVQYAPLVKMRVSPVMGRRNLLENDVVTIRCSAEGRPDNFTWSWVINGSTIENEKTDQYRIRLSRELFNVTVVCIATTFAEGSDQTILTFQYAPHFTSPTPVIYAGALGERLRMRCQAEGNPRPEVEWHLMSTNPSLPTTTGIGALIGRGEVFEREKIYETDFGAYLCVARAPGFPTVSKKIILAKKSAPKIKPAKPVYAAIGAPARLPCTINAVPLPPPEGLLWLRRDVILRPTSHRKFSTQEFLGGVVHVMSFSHVLSTDFGFYNCSAVNAYGSDSQTLELRRDDELSISSLSGILAALVVAILLGLLIFFCCRRRQYRMSHLKGTVFSNPVNNRKHEIARTSTGFVQTNHLPQVINSELKDDTFGMQSSSGSTEAEALNRYQFPPETMRRSSALGNTYNQPPRTYSPSRATEQFTTMRSFSPVCKYALIDGRGQQIPVCNNMVTFAGHMDDLRLADGSGTATLCIPSDYQSIPISYVNVPVTEQFSSSTEYPERLCVVTAPDMPPDSDIIVNTQVTHV